MTERQMCDVLVKNGYVLTMDNRRLMYASGAVAITGRHITAVGPEHDILAAWQGRRVFDAGGGHPFIRATLRRISILCTALVEAFSKTWQATLASKSISRIGKRM